MSEMVFAGEEADAYGHKKLGGVGDLISERLRALSPKYNGGRRINAINQRLGYLVRCGDPDALDSIVPMAFGNLALDLILEGISGRLVAVRNGRYDNERPDRRRHQPQEGDRRRPPLPARTPAAEVREVREQAGLHHDRRLLRATRYGMGPASRRSRPRARASWLATVSSRRTASSGGAAAPSAQRMPSTPSTSSSAPGSGT